MRASAFLRFVTLALALALASGCAGARPGPVDAVHAYVSALRDARYDDAYRMLSSETRRVMPYEEFSRLARENPEEIWETARWLERVDTRAPVTARLEMPSGESLVLVEEGGTWRLDPTALDFYGQRTPRQTLRSFVRALERRRWDVLLRFAPRQTAEGLTAEQLRNAWERGSERDDLDHMLGDLRRFVSDRPIEVSGDRATMQYGPNNGYTARLVREDGVWKIEDPG